jgi:NADH-quinone oxidoreductase subunit J
MNLFILIVLVIAALWTVLARSLIRAAIGLALTSVVLAIIMFRLNSALAAVFELSVCAGLIPVLFISTISLTEPLSQEDKLAHMKARLSRFWFLPVILIAVAIIFSLMNIKLNINLPPAESEKDVRAVMWNIRQIDLIGQIIILLTGAFGVVVLFKERFKK